TFNFVGPNYPTDGPYQSIRIVNRRNILYRPMPYYDDMTCGASIANVIGVELPSGTAQVAAAINGNVDIVPNFRINAFADLQGDTANYTLHLDSTLTGNIENLTLNVDPTYQDQPNPLANTKVRLALALALD